MPILRQSGTIEADQWIKLDKDDLNLPVEGKAVMSLAQFHNNGGRSCLLLDQTGLALENDEDPAALGADLNKLDLIILNFPAFSDGRAFSQARRLRRMGFRGELRAAGNILPDQIQFMRQVGFDSFEITSRFSDAIWREALKTLSLSYQQDSQGTPSIWPSRRRRLARPTISQPVPWAEQPHAG